MYQLIEILSSQYNRKDEVRYNRSMIFCIKNTKNGKIAMFQLDRISKKNASLRCNTRHCGHRLSLEHNIPTEEHGKYARKIAESVTKEELHDINNWLKVFHDHSKRCRMTGPTYCDKTEHQFGSCESENDFKIIKRKYRSFVVGQKVEKPDLSYAKIIDEADGKFDTNRYADFKTKKCGIDDKTEIQSMQRAHLVSHGENLYDPQYDQKIENRLRTITVEDEFDVQQFVWEEEGFIYFGLAKDLMLIQNSKVSMDGTFDDSNALKVKKKKTWEQLYIITKLNRNEKCDRTFSESIGFCLMKKRTKQHYKTFFQFLKRIFKQQFPDSDDFCPRIIKTDFEAAAILASIDEFPGVDFELCSFHMTKSFREKIREIYGGNFDEIQEVKIAWRYLRAVPYMNWSSSSLLVDEFLKLIGNTLPNDDRKFILTKYLKNTYFNRNGNFKHFSYLNWNHYSNIINGEFCTTTNASESLNSAYNKNCRSGFRSTNIVAENIRNFKLKMLKKRGLIAHHGEIKMNKVRAKTLERQAKIRKCCDSISFMDIQTEIDGLPKLMNDIGVANPSQFTLEQIPSDFLYLDSIFC